MYLSAEAAKSINNTCSLIGFSLLFVGMLVQAIVSNYYIEPKIEKRLGVKLQYMPVWRSMPLLGYFLCRNTELLLYILPSYICWRFRNESGVLKLPWNCLYKAGYKIKEAPKNEIIFAWIVLINGCAALLALLSGSLVQFIF